MLERVQRRAMKYILNDYLIIQLKTKTPTASDVAT